MAHDVIGEFGIHIVEYRPLKWWTKANIIAELGYTYDNDGKYIFVAKHYPVDALRKVCLEKTDTNFDKSGREYTIRTDIKSVRQLISELNEKTKGRKYQFIFLAE